MYKCASLAIDKLCYVNKHHLSVGSTMQQTVIKSRPKEFELYNVIFAKALCRLEGRESNRPGKWRFAV